MGVKVTITIDVEVAHVCGKFASKDEIAEAIVAELEGSDPGTLTGVGADGESEYEISSWEVNHQ